MTKQKCVCGHWNIDHQVYLEDILAGITDFPCKKCNCKKLNIILKK